MATTETNMEIHQSETEENTSTDNSFEGTRMKILRNVMLKTIKTYTANLKLTEPLKNVNTELLEVLHRKTISQLETNIQCELEQMYKEENLEVLLNTLDKLLAENQPTTDTQIWRPSGNVEKDVRCEVAILKKEKLKVLKKTLSDLEAQNKLVIDRVKKGEQRLLCTRDKLVAIGDDIEQIVDQETESIKSKQKQMDGKTTQINT